MEREEKVKSGGGCIGSLVMLFVFAVVVGLGTAIWYVSQPQDLSDIGGYSKEGGDALAVSPARDLTEVLRKSLEGGHSVVIRENEINRMLSRELEMKQGGFLGEWVKIKQVLVRLHEGMAELIIVREVMGHQLTVSMFMQVEQTEDSKGLKTRLHVHGGSFDENVPLLKKGGRFGSLTVPQGFLILVMSDFKKIGVLFEKEIEMGFEQMARFKIEKGSLHLDPKGPSREEEETF